MLLLVLGCVASVLPAHNEIPAHTTCLLHLRTIKSPIKIFSCGDVSSSSRFHDDFLSDPFSHVLLITTGFTLL